MTQAEAERFMTETLAIWTEQDRTGRRQALAKHFHEDVVFYDPDGTFTGHDQLESFSDRLQQRFHGQHFEITDGPSVVGNAMRTYWRFGPVTGMDFAILAAGRIKTLYAFVELPDEHNSKGAL